MIKAVIFDIDGTLYDYDENNEIAMHELQRVGCELLGVSGEKFLQTFEEAKKLVKAQLPSSVAAQHNRILYCQRTAELLGKSALTSALKMYAAYWDTFIENMKPYAGAAEFLRALKEKNIRTAICTDMTAHIQYRKIERLGFAEQIDCMVSSEEAGGEKPEPIMFHIALDKLGAKAAETIYIGDAFEKDVQGAMNAGIRPVWFTANRQTEAKDGVLAVKSYDDKRLWTLCGIEK